MISCHQKQELFTVLIGKTMAMTSRFGELIRDMSIKGLRSRLLPATSYLMASNRITRFPMAALEMRESSESILMASTCVCISQISDSFKMAMEIKRLRQHQNSTQSKSARDRMSGFRAFSREMFSKTSQPTFSMDSKTKRVSTLSP